MSVVGLSLLEELAALTPARSVALAIVGRIDGASRHEVVQALLAAGCRGVILSDVKVDELDFDLPANVHLTSGIVHPARVRLLLRRYLQPSREFSPAFRIPDLLQMICLSGASGLVVGSREGEDVGTIDVLDGEIWGARDKDGEGLAALGRLCALPTDGRIRSLDRETLEARSLQGDWQALLLEALHSSDEDAHVDAPVDTHVDAEAGEQAFERARDQGMRALLERDYPRAAVAFRRAAELRPEDEIVRLNLERLRALGHAGEEESP